jgi:hypothetical protein
MGVDWLHWMISSTPKQAGGRTAAPSGFNG